MTIMRLIVLLFFLAGCKGKSDSNPTNPPPGKATADKAPVDKAPVPKPTPSTLKDKCGELSFVSLEKFKIKAQVEMPPVKLEGIPDVTPSVNLLTGDAMDENTASLKVRPPVAGEETLAKAKATIEANTKSKPGDIKWTKDETTPDGYRLAYSMSHGFHFVQYLKKIGDTKFVCEYFTAVESSAECGLRACESLKPL